jgi:hypothetical protein
MRLLVALAVLALASACGGSKSSNPEVDAGSTPLMVLPASEIGDAADGLEVDPDSGFMTLAEAAESTLDPNDTAEELRDAGWVIGYELDYTGTVDGSPVEISSQVSIFRTPEQAEAYVNEKIGGASSLEGAEIAAGAELTSVETEQIEGPGDNAWRGTATAELGDVSFSSSIVAFTVAQAAAQVSASYATGQGVPADLEELASKLEDRILGVSDGDVGGAPVPIPTETTETTATEDPALERMVLGLEDLPDGVSIETDGYSSDGGDVSFSREFALGNATIGRSQLIGLESNVERMDSAAEAAVVVQAVSGVVKGEAGKKLFSDAFAEGAGFDAESLEIEELPGKGLGDASTVLHATFDTRVGPFEAVFVFVASGRAAGQIYAAGAKGKIVPADVLALARTMAKKMEAEER